MTIFFTSDTHFGHARINELANRPFDSVEEMNETIIDRWNETVKTTDTVFHLGDVALGKLDDSLPLMDRLNGHKHLIVGNHDRVFAGNKPAYIERFMPVYRAFFDTINYSMVWNVGKHTVRLNHFPYSGDSQSKDRHSKYRPVDDGTILIHGHTHSQELVSFSEQGTLQIHVGVDAHLYYPVTETLIIDTIRAIDNLVKAVKG